MMMCRIGSDPVTMVGVGVGPGVPVPVTVPVGVPVEIETCASDRSLLNPYHVARANSAETTSSVRARSDLAPEDSRIIAPLPSALAGNRKCGLPPWPPVATQDVLISGEEPVVPKKTSSRVSACKLSSRPYETIMTDVNGRLSGPREIKRSATPKGNRGDSVLAVCRIVRLR